jgi:hypothetical protein
MRAEKRDKAKMDDTLEINVIFEADGTTLNNMRLTRVDHNLYSIEETPIFLDCVSYKDIIEADLQPDASLMFRRVVKKSEWQRYDFILKKEFIDSEGFRSLLDRVTEAEGHWEIVLGGCVIIHLPPGCELDPYQETEDICGKPIPDLQINRIITAVLITAPFQNFPDSTWEHVKLLRVGCVPTGLGTPSAYVLIQIDDAPLIRVDVYSDVDCNVFEDVIIWREFVIVGFGSQVYIINYHTEEIITFDLDSYFGHFYPGDEWLIIASGCRLLRIGPTGSIEWTTKYLGLDGVIVDTIEDNLIKGQGEWDPPGEWHPFQVRLDTGENIAESLNPA